MTSPLGPLLRAAAQTSLERLSRATVPYGVTAAEWPVLAILHTRGPLAPSAIGEGIGLSRGAVTRLVDRLRAKGLVVRARGGSMDRRYQTIALTGGAALLVPVLAPLVAEAEAASFAPLSPARQRQLAELLALLESDACIGER